MDSRREIYNAEDAQEKIEAQKRWNTLNEKKDRVKSIRDLVTEKRDEINKLEE